MNAATPSLADLWAASPPISQHLNLGAHYEHSSQAWRGELQNHNHAIGGNEEGFARPPEMDAQSSSNPQDLDFLNSPPMWQSGQNEDGTVAIAVDFEGNNFEAEACSVPAFPRGVTEGSVPNVDIRLSGNAHGVELELNNQQQREAPSCRPRGGRPGKRKRESNWTKKETSVLVECKKKAILEKGSLFCKGRPTATNWDAISAEIKNQLETIKTGNQCRLRWDTLVKSYQKIKAHCKKSNKEFSERGELRLATTLHEDGWYRVIDQFCRPKPRKTGALKRDNFTRVDNGRRSASPQSSQSGMRHSCKRGKSCRKQVAIPGFNALRSRQRSTLLDLVNGRLIVHGYFDGILEYSPRMAEVCEWLSVVQKRSSSEVSYDVNKLVKKKLVHISFDGVYVTLKLPCLGVYEKFVKKVACKNPHYDTFRGIYFNSTLSILNSFSLPQQITTLTLDGCWALVKADLRNLPKLRCLIIKFCRKLEVVSGWVHLRELGWLSIKNCDSYKNYPTVQCLPSLTHYALLEVESSQLPSSLEPQMSQFVPLRKLEVRKNGQLQDCGDLSSLKYLQVLLLHSCEDLSTISGLSGLHSLTTLNLYGCPTLSKLPDLGHMKALVDLVIGRTGVEEIVGVDELVSLEKLYCSDSKLKRLPDLHHLPRLQYISLDHTPLIEDPSSIYFGKNWVRFNEVEKTMEHVELLLFLLETIGLKLVCSGYEAKPCGSLEQADFGLGLLVSIWCAHGIYDTIEISSSTYRTKLQKSWIILGDGKYSLLLWYYKFCEGCAAAAILQSGSASVIYGL